MVKWWNILAKEKIFVYSFVVQLFKLGPVQSVCLDEGSDTSNEAWMILYFGIFDLKRLEYISHETGCSLISFSLIFLIWGCDLLVYDLFDFILKSFLCIFQWFLFVVQKSYSRGFAIFFNSEKESGDFHYAFEQWKKDANQGAICRFSWKSSSSFYIMKIEFSFVLKSLLFGCTCLSFWLGSRLYLGPVDLWQL